MDRRTALSAPLAWGASATMPGCAHPPRPSLAAAADERPHPFAPGRLIDFGLVPSAHVAPRRVVVWEPPRTGHDAPAVLYMHDGQNLFEPAHAYTGVTWGVAEAITRLVAAGAMRPTMVVAVWNTPARTLEYAPARPLERLPADWRTLPYRGEPLSDGYLRFLCDELKPMVDARFAPSRARADTATMGASMGGLISLYALLERPDVFAAAGCVSTHWPLTVRSDWLDDPALRGQRHRVEDAMFAWLAERLPAPGTHRLYMDHGTVGLDARYAPYQARADAVLRARGWQAGRDFISRTWEGGEHTEAAWRAHVETPLAFLLPA